METTAHFWEDIAQRFFRLIWTKRVAYFSQLEIWPISNDFFVLVLDNRLLMQLYKQLQRRLSNQIVK